MRQVLNELEEHDVREMIVKEHKRPDGRGFDDIRSISESALRARARLLAFTRGQTQALVVATLGTKVDEQRVEELEGQSWKSFMLHYNFPPYSGARSGVPRRPRAAGDGHGALAERAGPSSRATRRPVHDPHRLRHPRVQRQLLWRLCGGSLSLMDAGVPIKSHVAGVAMGLVKEGNEFAVLTDIQGVEDHLGDMDFKVAGTADGITALQMDIKISGSPTP